jgi:DNA topoisomerase-3
VESAFKLLCRVRHNTFSIWREVNGKKLTDAHIRQLVIDGRTAMIKGFKKKDGTGVYNALLVVSPEFKVKLDFAPEHGQAE